MEAAERTVAGRYRLVDRLGSGGMGTVWRAEDLVLGRGVALKEVTFPPGVSEQEREVLRERTRREGRAAAALDDPSAVTVFDVAEEDGTPFLVMELVEARTLSEVISAEGPLTPRRTAEVGLAVLGALQAAHERGILHRDVKPSNVLIRRDGRVVLTDFGIATFAGDSTITSTGLLLGTPSYISPERASGDQPGPASDLWSLGATLFTAVEGRPPFDRGEALPTLAAVVAGEHEPFVAAGPLAPVLDGLLANDPGQRLTAEQARAELQGVLAAEATTATTPSPPAPAAVTPHDSTEVLSLRAVAHEVQHERAVPPAQRTAVGNPGPGRSRWVLPVALTLFSLLLLALGAGLVSLLSSGGQPTDPSALRSPTATGPSARATQPPAQADHPAQAGSSEPVVPAGWRTHPSEDWSVATPRSYAASMLKDGPQYRDPTTGRTLRVSATAPGDGGSDAVQDRRDQAKVFAANPRHEDYREISIKPIDYRGLKEAADWEFTYSEAGASFHVLSRVFVIDRRGYSLYFQTRSSDDWTAARAEFEKMAASFSTRS